jgi:hypothetical protein
MVAEMASNSVTIRPCPSGYLRVQLWVFHPRILRHMRALYLFSACLFGALTVAAQSPTAPASSKTQAPPPTTAAPAPGASVVKADKAALDEVKTYCASLDDYKKDATPQLFADASDQAKPGWRRVGTERELESLTDALFQHMTTARVWLKDKNIVAVESEMTAGASDWLLASDYCFRPDGTLALLHSEYRDEKNEFITVRDESFDRAGVSLDDAVQILDLRSRRPKKISRQIAASEQVAPLYKKTSDLPFHRLLKTP